MSSMLCSTWALTPGLPMGSLERAAGPPRSQGLPKEMSVLETTGLL